MSAATFTGWDGVAVAVLALISVALLLAVLWLRPARRRGDEATSAPRVKGVHRPAEAS